MKEKIKVDWSENEVNDLTMNFLFEMFRCDTGEGVDVALHYARFMAGTGVNSDNYPIFFKLLATGNHWVIDALFNGKKPENFLIHIQPNKYMLYQSFLLMGRWKLGEIYPPLLMLLLQMIKVSYEAPAEGFRLFPLTSNDINNIGKHLDKSKGPASPENRVILHILDRIASLVSPGGLPVGDKKTEEAATQANNIRGKFLDPNKNMREAIPLELLERGSYKEQETPPTTGS